MGIKRTHCGGVWCLHFDLPKTWFYFLMERVEVPSGGLHIEHLPFSFSLFSDAIFPFIRLCFHTRLHFICSHLPWRTSNTRSVSFALSFAIYPYSPETELADICCVIAFGRAYSVWELLDGLEDMPSVIIMICSAAASRACT